MKVILDLKDDNCLYDANGMMLISALNMNYEYFKPVSDKTVELVKLGLTVDDIIKLKNMELL